MFFLASVGIFYATNQVLLLPITSNLDYDVKMEFFISGSSDNFCCNRICGYCAFPDIYGPHFIFYIYWIVSCFNDLMDIIVKGRHVR